MGDKISTSKDGNQNVRHHSEVHFVFEIAGLLVLELYVGSAMDSLLYSLHLLLVFS